MTHTVRIELADVAAWTNLEAALWAAARGKRTRPDVAAFIADSPRRLAQVRHALLQGRLPDGQLRAFAIRDPKPRLIHAAPFADRVAQHALMRLLEPRLEAALVPTSFACRPGRGVHAALTHALLCTRRWPWVLQLDVAHCFPSIPHAPLLALVRRRLRGSAFDLLAHIVGGHAASPGSGLPIGSLTSQHLANQYLGELDREAIAHPATRAHVRYMDDVLLWCESAADARALRDHLLDWLPRTLGLQFKPPAIQRSNRGFTFCGFRLRPDGLRLGRRRQRAWRHGWRALHEADAAGRADEAWLQQRAEVLRTLALPTGGAIRAWCRAVMAGPPGVCGAAAAAADDGAPGRCRAAVYSASAGSRTQDRGPPAGAARWQLEQQRQELPFCTAQRERAG